MADPTIPEFVSVPRRLSFELVNTGINFLANRGRLTYAQVIRELWERIIAAADKDAAPPAAGMIFCVICLAPDGDETLHLFSTPHKREAFIDSDEQRTHLSYDYALDAPERHERPVHGH